MNYSHMPDGNSAALGARENDEAEKDAAAESALSMYGTAARAELRDAAREDGDAIRQVVNELHDLTLQQAVDAALTNDAFALFRLLAPALVHYVNVRENEAIEVERVALRMWREAA